MHQLRRFYETYDLMLAILAAAAVLSWPGWWPRGSLGEGIASNVFATVVVTPFLLFGIDRAVREIEYKRKQARVGTIQEELKFLIGRIINTCATGTERDLVPGLWNVIFMAANTPEATDRVGTTVVTYLLANQDAATTAFAGIDWPTYDKMIERAYGNISGLRQVLALADDAITHEDFALLWKAARELETLEDTRSLYQYAAKERPDFLTSAPGRTLLESLGHDIWSLVLGLCRWYSRT